MKFSFRAILLLCAFVCIKPSLGQSPCDLSISGRVMDSETGEPLSFAGVFIVENKLGVQADSAGFFRIKSICPGSYALRITHIGCLPEKFEIRLDSSLNRDFFLSHDDHVLEEFVVVDEGKENYALAPIGIKPAELELVKGNQLADQTANLPGVNTLKTGTNISKPVFRGLHSNRLIILNNGIRQEGQYWGSEHAPEIDSYVVNEMSFVEGVDALEHASDALGGVLIASPPDIFKSDKLNGSFFSSFSSNGRGGSVSGSIAGRVSEKLPLYFRFQGSLKKLGWIKTSDSFLRNTGTEEVNYSYALGWKNDVFDVEVFYSRFNQEIGIYRYSHLGNLTDLLEVLSGREQPDTLGFSYEIERPFQDIDHELFKTRLGIKLDSESSLSFTYARQFNARREYDIHGRNRDEEIIPELYYVLTTHSGQAVWKSTKGNNNLRVGASALFRVNNFRGRGFMPNYRNQNIGFFAVNVNAFGLWKLKYGARFDRYSADVFEPVGSEDAPESFVFGNVAAAVAAQREIENGDWTLSLSTLWRPPAINEQFSQGLHHGVSAIEQGNPDLERERSWTASYTFRKVFNRNTFLGSAYVNYINGFIFPKPTDIELTIRGAFPRFDYSQNDALYWGLDLMYTSQLAEAFSANLKTSLVWASNLSNGTYFINIPAHRFSGSLRYQLEDAGVFKTPFVELNIEYTMRQYRAPVVFPYEAVLEGEAVLPESFDFAPAPDGYFLTGLRAGCRVKRFSISLQAENLFNTTYRNYMNRFRYYADEPGINLTARINYKF